MLVQARKEDSALEFLRRALEFFAEQGFKIPAHSFLPFFQIMPDLSVQLTSHLQKRRLQAVAGFNPSKRHDLDHVGQFLNYASLVGETGTSPEKNDPLVRFSLCQLPPRLDEFLDTAQMLKPNEKLVLRKLLKLRQERGTDQVKITFTDLAKMLSVLRITVRRATDKLIEKGFLVYEGSFIDPGPGPRHCRAG